jgi:RNA polymerase sigma factor (sigma-70 family)
MSSFVPTVRQDVVSLIPALRQFARRFCRNPNDADDLVQETLLRALAGIESFERGTRLRSWLFTIMRNTHHTQYHREKRMVPGLNEWDTLLPTSQPGQEWAVRGRELKAAMNLLSDCQRDALERIVIEGQSYDVAAEASNCAIGTIKSRVHRAREQLAIRLGETATTVAAI